MVPKNLMTFALTFEIEFYVRLPREAIPIVAESSDRLAAVFPWAGLLHKVFMTIHIFMANATNVAMFF